MTSRLLARLLFNVAVLFDSAISIIMHILVASQPKMQNDTMELIVPILLSVDWVDKVYELLRCMSCLCLVLLMIYRGLNSSDCINRTENWFLRHLWRILCCVNFAKLYELSHSCAWMQNIWRSYLFFSPLNLSYFCVFFSGKQD